MTTFATALVSPFVGWLVYAAVFHAISVVFDGDGPFPTTLALGAGLGVLVTLWSAVLWTHALRHARALSFRDAALTVALPALVGVALSVSTLVGAL